MIIVFDEPLKPCPFCGALATLRQIPMYDFGDNYIYRIECSECGAAPREAEQNDVYQIPHKAINKAARFWNTRVCSEL